MTGFYPLYDGDEDQVDRIARISSVAFQRIIPRYRLSSSDTRDTGLGPTFYEVPVYRSGSTHAPNRTRAVAQDLQPGGAEAKTAPIPAALPPAPLYPWQGQRIDVMA